MRPALRLEVLAIAAGLAVWTYIGWDGALWDARFQLVLHAGALTAVVALLVMGLRGVALPRTRIDLPILALLAAFALATLFAENYGLAARALAAILATVAMLPVALLLLRRRAATTALVVIVPTLLLSAGTLVGMLWRRAEWVLVGGPGLPPIRVLGEGTAFGSVAVPPFIMLGLLPLTFLIAEPRVRRWLQVAIVVIGVPLTLLSGSRSAWVAIGVIGLLLLVPTARRLRPRLPSTPREIGLVLLGVAGAAFAFALVAPRLTTVSSLIYRGYLWRDTLDALAPHVITGIGPGTMPWARQAAAPALSFPVRQPHSHDIPLGILGDAGVIGLLAALGLFVVFVMVARPWQRHAAPGRYAFAVLAGFAVASLFEDLTFLPNFNLLVILLVAMVLADADAVTWQRLRLPRPLAAAGELAAAALLVVALVGDAAAIDYRFGDDAAAAHDWPASEAWFEQSVALDPWHPAGPKSLTVAADMAGQDAVARRAAQQAVELNAGDGPSWTNLAILCLESGDRACASTAAARAVDTASLGGPELMNAAFILERLGESKAADEAYRLALLTNPYASFSFGWPRNVEVGDTLAPEIGSVAGSIDLIIARRATGAPINPADYPDPAPRALAAAIVGDRAAARAALDTALAVAGDDSTTWDLTVVLQQHWGEPIAHALAVDAVLHGGPLSSTPPRVPGLTFDIASFRMYPRDGLVSSALRFLPDKPWPWVLEPLLAP